jgi:gliding motility-associated-like protein
MDTDGDGINDEDDIDDDNDGILDVMEDMNEDGDNDPSTNPTDTDGDGVPDYLDIDSDDDGIPDNVEAQSTFTYIPPNGGDSDGDGLLDVYEFSGNEGLFPVDTDGDLIPDYLDEDSDDDTIPDNIEGHDYDLDGEPDNVYRGSDKDGDGLDDGYEGEFAIDVDPNDEIDDPENQLPNTNNANDLDYREVAPDYLAEGLDFEIYNIVTPNGDGKHDFFEIEGIERFPENSVKIFNRWGVLVYDTEGYNNQQNNFRGISSGRVTVKKDEVLPTGTYYYTIDYVKEGKTISVAGYLYLNK